MTRWARYCVIAVLLAWNGASYGAIYTVKFDCYSSSTGDPCYHEFSLRATLDDSIFSTIPWGSSADATHEKGSRLLNGSGRVIKAIHIRAKNGDTFQVDPSSGGRLFPDVWRKTDNTEVIFNGGQTAANQVDDNAYFWNSVLPGTPSNPDPNLEGYADDERIAIPNDGNWVRVSAPPHPLDPQRWGAIVERLPKRYSKVDAAVEAPDGKSFLAVSNGDVLMYDSATRKVRHVADTVARSGNVDRVTIEKKGDGVVYRLWEQDRIQSQIDSAKVRLGSAVK